MRLEGREAIRDYSRQVMASPLRLVCRVGKPEDVADAIVYLAGGDQTDVQLGGDQARQRLVLDDDQVRGTVTWCRPLRDDQRENSFARACTGTPTTVGVHHADAVDGGKVQPVCSESSRSWLPSVVRDAVADVVMTAAAAELVARKDVRPSGRG